MLRRTLLLTLAISFLAIPSYGQYPERVGFAGNSRGDSSNPALYRSQVNQARQLQQAAIDNAARLAREPHDVPGEVLIIYQVAGSGTPRGQAVLSEQARVATLIGQLSGIRIAGEKPVCSYIVNKMVSSDMTEAEVRADAYIKVNPKFRTAYSTGITGYSSARMILIKVHGAGVNGLPGLIDRIKNTNQQLADYGVRLTDVEPNYIYYVDTPPNDPYYGLQWAYPLTQAELGWNIEKGSRDVKVGIIDTGVDPDHPDLKDNIDKLLQYDFVDIDTNAYKAAHYTLIAQEDYTQPDSFPNDYNGHGTHCAGIVAAEGNNGIGICGVAPNVTLVPLRAGFSILDGAGQEVGALETDNIINAIDYAVLNDVNVLNMSFGGEDSSTAFRDAIENAAAHGIVMVAAAGNSTSSTPSYPAGFEGVISVAATDQLDQRAPFSNYGSWVDVCAPGVNIYSTVPTTGGMLHDPSGYRYASGTSMAAPFVAGLAALILSKNSNTTPGAVKYILEQSSDLPKEQACYIGAGRVDIYKALLENVTDVPQLQAEITNLSDDQLITSSTAVYGSATGDSYKLYLGTGSVYPSTWSVIDSGGPTTDGLLGNLDITQLSTGSYVLRLVTEKDSMSSETRISLRVSKGERLKEGFPIDVGVPDPNSTGGYLLVTDLDGDGKKEIIAAPLFSTELYAYDYKGEPLPGWPVHLPEQGWIFAKPSAYDLDNDGYEEIIVYGQAGSQTEFPNDFVCVYDHNGKLLSGWPKFLAGISDGPGRFVAVADVKGDGQAEIIAPSSHNGAGQLYAFDKNGNVLPNWPYNFPAGYMPRSAPVIADIDGDGKKDIVVTSFSDADPNGHTNQVIALGWDGNKKSDFNYDLRGWGWPLAGGGINGDGSPEIFTQDGPVDSTGNPLPWNISGTNVYSSIALGKVPGGSGLAVLYGDANLKAYLTDYSGHVFPGWPISNGQYAADGNHIIADLDGDGQLDVVIMWEPDTPESMTEKPGINVYDIQGNEIPGFPKYQGVYYFDDIVADDIDDDGNVELIGYDTQDGKIIALDLAQKYDPAQQQWARYLHDNSNDNFYTPPPAPALLYHLKDVTINEDETASLTFCPATLDLSSCTMSAIADTSAIALVVAGRTVNIVPAPNWNGAAHIKLAVADGEKSDSCEFKVTVLPVDDPPGPFSLLSPADSDSVVIDENSVNDSLSFAWQKSRDIDSDTIWYLIRFSKPFDFMNRDSVFGASVSFPLKKVSAFMTASNITDAYLKWNVLCTDGTDTVADSNGTSIIKITRLIDTGVEGSGAGIPKEMFLSQNYPNPFNPSTRINFGLNKDSRVSIKVYDILGQLVATLEEGEMKAGYHSVLFDGRDHPSGIYLYRMQAGSFVKTGKMVLLK